MVYDSSEVYLQFTLFQIASNYLDAGASGDRQLSLPPIVISLIVFDLRHTYVVKDCGKSPVRSHVRDCQCELMDVAVRNCVPESALCRVKKIGAVHIDVRPEWG